MQLTINHLLDEQTGATNRAVLKAMIHRRAMADYGALSPVAIRQAQRFYATVLAQRKTAWRQRHGLPVETVLITPYGKNRDGVRRSAF